MAHIDVEYKDAVKFELSPESADLVLRTMRTNISKSIEKVNRTDFATYEEYWTLEGLREDITAYLPILSEMIGRYDQIRAEIRAETRKEGTEE